MKYWRWLHFRFLYSWIFISPLFLSLFLDAIAFVGDKKKKKVVSLQLNLSSQFSVLDRLSSKVWRK